MYYNVLQLPEKSVKGCSKWQDYNYGNYPTTIHLSLLNYLPKLWNSLSGSWHAFSYCFVFSEIIYVTQIFPGNFVGSDWQLQHWHEFINSAIHVQRLVFQGTNIRHNLLIYLNLLLCQWLYQSKVFALWNHPLLI